MSFQKALQGLPGFAPDRTLEDGVEEIARFLRDGGLGTSAFTSRLFIRLEAITAAMRERRLDGALRWTPGSAPTAVSPPRPAGE